MRIIVLSLILFCCGTCPITAQSDYIVTTPSTQEIPVDEEEQFIKNNFPLQPLCKWTPGMKFMFVPSTRNMFLPTLSSYDTEKGIDNSLLKHKILTFTGTEEKAQNISTGTNYSTRFVFECEGEKYYYDIKNMRLDEICEKAPRAGINGLVYLKDVDTAKELLIGKTVYIQSESARVDDANNYLFRLSEYSNSCQYGSYNYRYWSRQSGISSENRIQRYTGTFLLSGSRSLANELRHGPE